MKKDLSIYIHIPFCTSKCGYCSFYSVSDTSKMQQYIKAIIRDLTTESINLSDRNVITIYFGGGTPSLLNPDDIKEILNAVYENYTVSKTAEITLEANPDSLDEEKLLGYKNVGINRLSIGVQSFNDNELILLSRRHTAKKAIDVINLAKTLNFKNISIDLIYNLPYSSLESLKTSVLTAISLDVNHISLYSLKLDENCAMAHQNLEMIDEDDELCQYLYICEELGKNGFCHYEISNFAKKGYNSVHNTVYWKLGDYLGIGVSAHSYIDKKRYYYKNNISNYIKNPIKKPEAITTITKLEEFVMLALRLSYGLDFKVLKGYCDKAKFDSILQKAKEIEKLQLGNIIEDRFVLNENGMYLSNTIISALLF
ncbi:MAG: radical SAM family heme chaperone HemW [Clostridia bacterium]